MKPFEAIRSVMNNSDITLAILLLAGVVAVKVLARTIWWGITPNAVFGLKSALASWAGTLVYIGAWAGALTFLAHRRDLRAEFGRVLTGVAAVWVIPTLAIAIVTITPPSLRTAVGILYAVDNVFTWLGLFSVARVLTQHDDSAAFRLILFSALAARAVSIVWGAIF